MGLMDKVKKILFDEDEVEIPVNSDELPERTPKNVNSKESQRGFIEYHHDDEVEEDTIKEVIVPKDDEEEIEEKKEEKSFNFPIDIDFEEELPSRSKYEEEIEEPIYTKRREFNFDEPPKKVEVEQKDYHKIINSSNETREKKPFKVTPIISPVYGILDKNYKSEEVVNKSEVVNKKETNRPRLFGPVSYNDEPLPEPHKYQVKEESSLKEELVELNTTISELINDTVNPNEILADDAPIEEVIQEEIITEEIDDIETSGIENEYIGNNNIEDAFEPTSEFASIKEADEEVEDITPSVDIDELIASDDDENLEDTIETDLFNLIDSMYKSETISDEEEE